MEPFEATPIPSEPSVAPDPPFAATRAEAVGERHPELVVGVTRRRKPQRRASADALDAWHEGGRQGPRPPGRLRPHRFEQVPALTRVWARPMYRLFADPDGRPRAGLRRSWT